LSTKEYAKWERKAAEQGIPRAQFWTGTDYELGKGVLENHVEALKWYKLAGANGEIRALRNVGKFYEMGLGVKKDLKEAARWYRKAAERGDDSAARELTYMYGNGEGVLEDYTEAYAWALIYKLNGMGSGNDLVEQLRGRLSMQIMATGQRRAKELLYLIETNKAREIISRKIVN